MTTPWPRTIHWRHQLVHMHAPARRSSLSDTDPGPPARAPAGSDLSPSAAPTGISSSPQSEPHYLFACVHLQPTLRCLTTLAVNPRPHPIPRASHLAL